MDKQRLLFASVLMAMSYYRKSVHHFNLKK